MALTLARPGRADARDGRPPAFVLDVADEVLVDHPLVRSAWGLSLAVDLAGCDPSTIRDAGHIRRFAVDLCELIGVRAYGPPIVVRFGRDPRVCGYSLVQLIETSLISGHFAEASDTAYIDVFSCQPYPPDAAVDFCRTRFGAAIARSTLTLRGEPPVDDPETWAHPRPERGAPLSRWERTAAGAPG
jgi:S-adenosylmethionine/arginine decarboxylase-like enzyme